MPDETVQEYHERIEHIRELNASKTWGHPNSAVAHCDELLDRITHIQYENARLRAENAELRRIIKESQPEKWQG
jgi:regulator of replication initiation timing